MPALIRKYKKIFGKDSTNNGVFGSAAALSPAVSTDPETIESLAAWSEGWDDATLAGERVPALEDMQGLKYDTDYHLAYIYQDGMQVYNNQTAYYINNLVRENATGKIWRSLVNDNVGNPLVEGTNWTLLANLSNVPTSTALLASNNLSDLISASAARTNLGLGTAAVVNTGTSSGQVPLIGTPSATTTLAGLSSLLTTPELDAAVDSQKIITSSVFAASKFNATNLVSSQTAVNAASIIFTGLSSAYSVYEFEFINVWPTVNGVGLVMQFSTDNGSTWQNTNYLSDGILDTTAGSATESLNNSRGPNLSLGDQFPNNNISSNATLGGLTGWAKVYNPSSSVHKLFHYRTVNIMSSDGTTLSNAQGYGIWRNTTPVNAVRFIFKTANSDTNNGNINGTIKMRGLV